MHVVELRQRHLAAFTKALRKHTPEDLDSVFIAPPAERYQTGLLAAFESGWFAGDDLPKDPAEWVGDLTYAEADEWSGKVWSAWEKATKLDPKS